jgi:hypothetical protein
MQNSSTDERIGKPIHFVGSDVHKETISLAVAEGSGETRGALPRHDFPRSARASPVASGIGEAFKQGVKPASL